MTGKVTRLVFMALLALAGAAFMPGRAIAQAMPVDPVIVEPVRPLFSAGEVEIPTVGAGCGQLSLAPLLFGFPALLLMSFYHSRISPARRISN